MHAPLLSAYTAPALGFFPVLRARLLRAPLGYVHNIINGIAVGSVDASHL